MQRLVAGVEPRPQGVQLGREPVHGGLVAPQRGEAEVDPRQRHLGVGVAAARREPGGGRRGVDVRRPVAQLEQAAGQQDRRHDLGVRVRCLPGGAEALPRQLEPEVCVGRGPERLPGGRRRPGQQGGIADPAGHRDALLGERPDLGLGRRVVVEQHREREHDPAALRRVAVGQLGHRPAQVLDGVLGHLVPLLRHPDRAVGGGRCCRREPGQVVLAPGERDRLLRAGQHLVPLRVGPAVAGAGQQQVDPLGGRARGGRGGARRSPPRRAARPRPTRRYDGPARPRRPQPARRGRRGWARRRASAGRARRPAPRGRPSRRPRRRRRGCGPPGRGAGRAATGWSVVTTASRVRAWVKATVPASGSSTSPASRAGTRASSTSSTGSPATAASRSSEKRRPRTAARRSSSRVGSGRHLQAAHDDVADGRGQRGAVARVEPGELDQEVGVAARAPVPVRDHLGRHDGARHGVHQAPGLLQRQAGEVEPGHVVARQLLARPRPGRRSARAAGRRVTTTARRCPGAALETRWRSTLRDAVSAQCRSSRTSRTGSDDDREVTSCARVSRARNASRSAPSSVPDGAPASSSSTWLSSSPSGELAQRLAPRPQAGGAVVLRAASRRHPEAALARRGHDPGDQPRLADAGLADEEGGRGRARLGAGQHVQQRGLLGLAADRRPLGRRTGRRRGRDGRRLPRAARTVGCTQPLVQGGVLDEHGLLEVAQLLPRVEAELVGQDGPDVAQRGQRLGLATGAGQGERVQRPDALAERVPRRRLLGGGHDDRVVAEGEQAQDPRLLGVEPELVERRALEDDLGLVGEVGVRVARPQREQLLDPVDALRDLRAGRPVGARPGGELARRAVRAAGGGCGPRRRSGARRRARDRAPAGSRGRWSAGPGASRAGRGPARGRGVRRRGRSAACRARRAARPRPRPAAPARRAGRRCRAGGPARPGPSAACGRRRPRWRPGRRPAPPGSFRARGPTRAAT